MPKKTQRKRDQDAVYRNNLDTMKLLISNKEFQQNIEGIRNRLRIPVEGFDRKAIENWWEALYAESDQVMDSKGYVQQEKLINQGVIRGQDPSLTRQQMRALRRQVPLFYWHACIPWLIRKYGLPEHFREYLKKYLLHNELDAPKRNFSHGWYPYPDTPRGQKYLAIHIYARLTKKEIRELRDYVQRKASDLPRYRPLKNIARDIKIEDMLAHRERESHDKSYEITAEEIAETVLGSRKKVKDVYESGRRIRAVRNHRFHLSEESGP